MSAASISTSIPEVDLLDDPMQFFILRGARRDDQELLASSATTTGSPPGRGLRHVRVDRGTPARPACWTRGARVPVDLPAAVRPLLLEPRPRPRPEESRASMSLSVPGRGRRSRFSANDMHVLGWTMSLVSGGGRVRDLLDVVSVA